ncbi:MAG: hypothetical protein QOE34_2436 [Verrucomicrobiota bacterium]|jgi:hypothetical protein
MPPNASTEEIDRKIVTVLLAAWLCVAAAAGLAGCLEAASAPVVAIFVWTLTALALFLCWKFTPLKRWAMKVDLRALVALHLTRFVGVYLFYLCSRGELPFAFAAPAGWGDITVASLAVLLLALSGARKWKMLIVWNTIGLTDILFVVLTALRIGLNDWPSMHALREFPLTLLPTFLVPLIIASHVLIFFRAAKLKAKTS